MARTLPVLLALGATTVVFFPITGSYFHSDDFLNLVAIVNQPFAHYVFQMTGDHPLLLRNAIYYLCFQVFGPEPLGWFTLVLCTHVLNVALLYGVVRRFTRSPWLACFGATSWGIAPANEGALGWYSVYGQVLVATFVLLVLEVLGRRVERGAQFTFATALACAGLLLLAAMSFGIGLALVGVFPLVVWLIFPGRAVARSAWLVLLGLPVLVVVGYLQLHRIAITLDPVRGWSLDITVNMLISYWQNSLFMFVHLLAIGAVALLGNFSVPIDDYPSVVTAALAVVFGGLVLAGAFAAPPATRRALMAFALLAVATYAIIAAGRGSMSGLARAPVRVYGAFAPRYHYVGGMFLSAVLCAAFAGLATRVRIGVRTRTVLLVSWFAATALAYGGSAWRVTPWDTDRVAIAAIVERVRREADATTAPQPVVVANQPFRAGVLGAVPGGWAAIYSVFGPRDLGRRVYFMEANAAVRAQAPPGSPLARMLIPGGVSLPPPS